MIDSSESEEEFAENKKSDEQIPAVERELEKKDGCKIVDSDKDSDEPRKSHDIVEEIVNNDLKEQVNLKESLVNLQEINNECESNGRDVLSEGSVNVTSNAVECDKENAHEKPITKKSNDSLIGTGNVQKPQGNHGGRFPESRRKVGLHPAGFGIDQALEEMLGNTLNDTGSDIEDLRISQDVGSEIKSGYSSFLEGPPRGTPNPAGSRQAGEPVPSPSWETMNSSEGGYSTSEPDFGPSGMFVQQTNVNVINTVRHVAWSLRSTIRTRSTTHRLQNVDEENALALLSKPCLNYKVMCNELLKYIKKNQKTADLKISLYMVASEAATLIKPFPRSVVEETVDGIVSLNLINEEIPSVRLLGLYMNDNEQFKVSDTVVNLIHWLLIHEKEPKIIYLPPQCFYSIFHKVNKGMNYQEPSHIFKLMNARSSAAECKWRALREGRKSNFAFYGDCLKVMHSVIHLGFFPLIHTDGLFGPGIYFYTDLQHCLDNTGDEGWCWGKSELGGQLKVVLVVEILEDPEVRFYNEYKAMSKEHKALTNGNDAQELYGYYVPRAELARIRYILVFVQRQPKIGPAVIAIKPKKNVGNWLKEKKKAFLVFGSFLAFSVAAHYFYVNKAIRSDLFVPKIPPLTSPVSTL